MMLWIWDACQQKRSASCWWWAWLKRRSAIGADCFLWLHQRSCTRLQRCPWPQLACVCKTCIPQPVVAQTHSYHMIRHKKGVWTRSVPQAHTCTFYKIRYLGRWWETRGAWKTAKGQYTWSQVTGNRKGQYMWSGVTGNRNAEPKLWRTNR